MFFYATGRRDNKTKTGKKFLILRAEQVTHFSILRATLKIGNFLKGLKQSILRAASPARNGWFTVFVVRKNEAAAAVRGSTAWRHHRPYFNRSYPTFTALLHWSAVMISGNWLPLRLSHTARAASSAFFSPLSKNSRRMKAGAGRRR